MNQVLRCDWLPVSRQDGAIVPAQDLPAVSRKKNFPESHVIKMA